MAKMTIHTENSKTATVDIIVPTNVNLDAKFTELFQLEYDRQVAIQLRGKVQSKLDAYEKVRTKADAPDSEKQAKKLAYEKSNTEYKSFLSAVRERRGVKEGEKLALTPTHVKQASYFVWTFFKTGTMTVQGTRSFCSKLIDYANKYADTTTMSDERRKELKSLKKDASDILGTIFNVSNTDAEKAENTNVFKDHTVNADKLPTWIMEQVKSVAYGNLQPDTKKGGFKRVHPKDEVILASLVKAYLKRLGCDIDEISKTVSVESDTIEI